MELELLSDKPLQDLQFFANVRCEAKCRTGVLLRAEKTTDGPHGLGARYRLTGALLGRRIATEYETIAYEPTRLAAWKAVSGPLPLTFSRTFEGVEGGTRVTMRYEGSTASSGWPARSSQASAGDSWKATIRG